MEYEFMSTNLPQMTSKGLFEEEKLDVAEAHIDKLFYVLFYAPAYLLRDHKNMETPATFVITESNDKPIASATVQYYEGEGDNPGNWSLVWSFDPADIPENATKYDLKDPLNHKYFRGVAGDKYGIKFYDSGSIVNLMTFSAKQLYKWLDENAKENEEEKIVLDGVFEATVKDGVKVFAVVPSGEVKTIIKDDLSIEK